VQGAPCRGFGVSPASSLSPIQTGAGFSLPGVWGLSPILPTPQGVQGAPCRGGWGCPPTIPFLLFPCYQLCSARSDTAG